VVKSRNVISQSEYSVPIEILAAQIPDAPTDLANVPLITNANQIGLTWLAPVFDGGSPVIDYRLWTDDATGADFIVQEESITSLSYTVQSLTQGSTY
jgi:hypothetical protein